MPVPLATLEDLTRHITPPLRTPSQLQLDCAALAQITGGLCLANDTIELPNGTSLPADTPILPL